MTWDLVGRRVARLHEHIVQVLHGLAVHRVGISLASIRKDVEEGSAGYGDAVNNSVVPELTGLDEAAKDEGRRRPDVRGALGSLFPESPESAPPVPVRRLLSAVLQLMAVALGAVLLLERIPGLPSWDTMTNGSSCGRRFSSPGMFSSHMAAITSFCRVLSFNSRSTCHSRRRPDCSRCAALS